MPARSAGPSATNLQHSRDPRYGIWYASIAHQMVLERGDDPIMREATTPDLMAQLAPLPLEILYDLGIGPAVRLAATAPSQTLDEAALAHLAAACWRPITRD